MNRRPAFTLIELLVVIAIIAVLLSILLPALGAVREKTKFVRCQSNLRTIGHAVEFYLDEHKDVFPEAEFYGCLGFVGRHEHHMQLGSQMPESTRPLNAYLSVEDAPVEGTHQTDHQCKHVFACPLDKGDAYLNLPGPFFREHGTSYTYASDFFIEEWGIELPTFGIMSCRSLPLTQVRYPAKKIVFQEPIFSPYFDMSNPYAQWHDERRHHANLLFADGHVAFTFTQIFVNQEPDENEVYY